jgi:hypothetical protein
MNELDTKHETVEALARLLPEATTAGGSFAGRLPHPQLLSAPDRRDAFDSFQKRAINDCLGILLRRAGIDVTTRIATGEGGDRQWPTGFVVSHTRVP